MTNYAKTSSSETVERNPRLKRKMHRFGMVMFIASQLVPLVVLMDMRYLVAGGYVPTSAPQLTGLVIALLMALSLILGWRVRTKATHREDRTGLLKGVFLLGLISIVLTFYQWSLRIVATSGRFGEIYYTMTGFAVFYGVVGIIALLSAVSRTRFIDSEDDDYWHVEAVSLLWSGIAAIWLFTYIWLFLF